MSFACFLFMRRLLAADENDLVPFYSVWPGPTTLNVGLNIGVIKEPKCGR